MQPSQVAELSISNLSCHAKSSQITAKRHELVVTTYQMCILLFFNEQDSISFEDLIARTKVPSLEELKRHLQSLYANPKCKILVRNTAGNPNESSSNTRKEAQGGDTFILNPNFESKMVRVKVPLIRGSDPVCHTYKWFQHFHPLLQLVYFRPRSSFVFVCLKCI